MYNHAGKNQNGDDPNKSNEKAVVEKSHYYQSLFNHLNEHIVVIDQDYKITDVNEPFLTFTGCQREEIIGKYCYEVSHGYEKPCDQNGEECHIREVFKTGKPKNCIHEHVKHDGSKVWVDIRLSPLTKKNEKIPHVIESTREVTYLMEMKRALYESKEHYKDLVDNVNSIIFRMNTEGSITFFNKFAQNFFGYSEDEILGNNVLGTILPETSLSGHDLSDLIKDIATYPEKYKSNENENLKKNGERVQISWSNAPIFDSKGNLEEILCVGNDITERKILENQLAHAQKLEAIGQLAAGIAHEINTPTQYVGDNTRYLEDAFNDFLTVLNKYNELLTAVKDGNPTEDLVKEVEALVEEADIDYLSKDIPEAIAQTLQGVERVTKIVRSMKDFSHPGVKEKTAVDINQAIESTITVARNEWKYVAELKTTFDPSLPKVVCYIAEFNQVVLNLIINAVHAIADSLEGVSHNKGKIDVSTCRDDGWVEIRISDNGKGIPKEVQPKIFDPFFTTKEVGKGTGQGLAISYNVIVDKHGGSLSFDTEEGKGTTFIIRIPIEPEEDANEDGGQQLGF